MIEEERVEDLLDGDRLRNQATKDVVREVGHGDDFKRDGKFGIVGKQPRLEFPESDARKPAIRFRELWKNEHADDVRVAVEPEIGRGCEEMGVFGRGNRVVATNVKRLAGDAAGLEARDEIAQDLAETIGVGEMADDRDSGLRLPVCGGDERLLHLPPCGGTRGKAADEVENAAQPVAANRVEGMLKCHGG